MWRCSNVSFSYHKSQDIADHAETSSRRRNLCINEMDLFQTLLQRLISL